MTTSLIIVEGMKTECEVLKFLFAKYFKCDVENINGECRIKLNDQEVIIKSVGNGNVEKVFVELKKDEFSGSGPLSKYFDCKDECDLEFLVLDADTGDTSKKYPNKTKLLEEMICFFEKEYQNDNTFLILNSPMLESIVDKGEFYDVNGERYKDYIGKNINGGFRNYLKNNCDSLYYMNDKRNKKLNISVGNISEKLLKKYISEINKNKKLLIFNMIFEILKLCDLNEEVFKVNVT